MMGGGAYDLNPQPVMRWSWEAVETGLGGEAETPSSFVNSQICSLIRQYQEIGR